MARYYAAEGSATRIRTVPMTALAMIIEMIPMALATVADSMIGN